MTARSANHLEDSAAWAQATLRRQVALLEQLAEAGLQMAVAIKDRAAQADAPPPEVAALAFSRVARAVRMTCLLQSHLIKTMDEAQRRAAFDRRCEDGRVEDAQDEAREDRSARVQAIVARVARAQGDGEDRIEYIIAETAERLETDDVYGDVLTRPIGELVALICRDLGLQPDWEQLGQEAWAQREGITPEPPPGDRLGAAVPKPGAQQPEETSGCPPPFGGATRHAAP